MVVTEAGQRRRSSSTSPLRPRLQSLLLLAVFFGWALFAVAMLAGPARDALRRRLPRRTAHRAVVAVGVVASALLIIVIVPIARPAVVRYDMVVQPVETTQLAVTLETASGDVQQRRALDVSDGWSGTTGTVETTAKPAVALDVRRQPRRPARDRRVPARRRRAHRRERRAHGDGGRAGLGDLPAENSERPSPDSTERCSPRRGWRDVVLLARVGCSPSWA